MKLLFYFLLMFVIYTYALYPLIIILLAKKCHLPIHKNDLAEDIFVSIVIAAKNEQDNIIQRIENLIEQTYPSELLEIIVVSGGSSDKTNRLINEYINRRHTEDNMYPELNLISFDEGNGKPFALNAGIAIAKGDIIVLSDARQYFNSDAIEVLISNFSDPKVGAVSGELYFRMNLESDIQHQMNAYWKYEKAIRRSESAVASIVGVTGAIYAIRKELYEPIRLETLLDDVVIPMSIVLKGYRVVFENMAIAYDIVSKNSAQEWRRKVRTLAGNWQLITLMPSLYNPRTNPIFFQFLSHKVFRTIIPFFLPPLLILSFILEGPFISFCMVVQVFGYGLAFVGFLHEPLLRSKVVGFVHFFVVMNLAAVSGFWTWVTGKCGDVWDQGYKSSKAQ